MVTALLTKHQLENILPNGSRQVVPVGGVPGLSVIVHPSGKKVFSLFYRAGNKARRYKVGVFPVTSIADARVRAMKILNAVADGKDPQAERVAARVVPVDTMEEVGNQFLQLYVHGKGLKSHKQIERHLTNYVNPRLGSKPIREVTRRNIIELVDSIALHNGPIMARRVYSTVHRMFRWCVRREILAANVATEIEMPGKLTKRSRYLSDDEIRLVWKACGRLGAVDRAFVRLLLVTGQRLREIAGLRRSEINKAEQVAVIDASRMKSGLDHGLPLTPLALQLIASVPVMLVAAGGGKARQMDHVFSSGRYGDRPINFFTGLKRAMDTAVLAELREQAEAAGGNPDEVEPMPGWVFHDLRRTCRTNLSKLGVSPEVAERVIGHLPTGVRMHYDLHEFLPEKRAALDAWAKRLTEIVGDTGKPVKLIHAA